MADCDPVANRAFQQHRRQPGRPTAPSSVAVSRRRKPPFAREAGQRSATAGKGRRKPRCRHAASGNSQPSQTRSRRSRSLTQNVLATNPCPTNASDNPELTNPGARQTFPPQRSAANRPHKLRMHKLWPGSGSRYVLIASQFANNNLTDAPDANRRKSHSRTRKRQLAGGGHVFGRAAFIAAPYAWFAQHPTWREASSREFGRCCRIL